MFGYCFGALFAYTFRLGTPQVRMACIMQLDKKLQIDIMEDFTVRQVRQTRPFPLMLRIVRQGISNDQEPP